MTIRWHGLVAPEEAATGDRRMFASQALTYREFPMFAAWQRVSSTGHQGSVVVGSWDAQYASDGGVWGRGEFLDPRIVPEVVEAVYLLDRKLIGPSVDLDPDLTYEVVAHPAREEDFAVKVTRGNAHGLTFVMGPAFPQVHITVDDDEEMTILASAGVEHVTFAVNKSSWRSMPVAPRETVFTFDDAITRIAEWSGGDPTRFGQAFLYQDKSLPPTNRESYRLPIADIHNGKLTLIPRAVFSAGTFLSNGHGGLDAVPEAEITQLQQVVTEIYDVLRETYADPRVIAPWQRGGRAGATSAEAKPATTATLGGAEMFTLDDEFTRVVTAAGVLYPPREAFADPELTKPTPVVIAEDSRIFGHLAMWKKCHRGIGRKCLMAPKSATGYKHFRLGSVKCDDGTVIPVGNITLGTGHADKRFGIIPAIEHYEHTGACVAVVNAGEDRFGIWVAGALVAGVSEERVAELRRSPLSGDWRQADGNLELCAALAVNSPGFPVLHEDGDGVVSLTAAGMLEDSEGHEVEHASVFSDVDAFLDSADRAHRASVLTQAFQDLLPSDGSCGCAA